MAIKIGDNSPWETVDSVQKLAKGVWSIGTECHGGIKLSRENSRSLPSDWHEREWFEEDSEWVMAAVAFPHAFPKIDPYEALTSFIEQFDYALPFGVDPDAFLRWVGRRTGYVSSHMRVWTLIECLDRAPTEELIWRAFNQEWSGCDAVDGEAIHHLMIILGGTVDDGIYHLQGDDKAFYDSLADGVTVYRGQNGAEFPGIAWTTDIEIAKSFARGHRGMRNPDPVVLAATVPDLGRVWTVITNRGESEVLIGPGDLVDIRPIWRGEALSA